MVRKGSEVLKSKIMEKQNAKEEFNNALNQNKDAYLVSQSDLYQDVLSVEVGNLEPLTPLTLEV